MPLPLIVGGLAVVAGVAGVGSGIHGGVKFGKAQKSMKEAQKIQEDAMNLFEKNNNKTTNMMDKLGKNELDILKSFDKFADLIEKIQNRPQFNTRNREGVNIAEYEAEELKRVSAAAGVILGGIGGAVAGTAGGIAAAGATTTAVMALGTASTGTAIASLSGAAASNAALAALGGGSLAAGGGGMALGSAVLGGATLGVGLLIGGIIFNVTGSKLSQKADEAYKQAKRTQKEVDRVVAYLDNLYYAAKDYKEILNKVENIYHDLMKKVKEVVIYNGKTNWFDFTEEEKQWTENLVLSVGLLYDMCNVKLVLKSDDPNGLNILNSSEISAMKDKSEKFLTELN